MGKALSTVRNPLRNFNIEERAHKAISRDKPIAAPKFAADVAEYERVLKGLFIQPSSSHHILPH